MINWVVSSCALILLVIAVRTVLKGKITPLVRYALWLPVLLRLLIPIQFGKASFSISNLTQPIVQQLSDKRYEAAHAQVLQQFADAGVQPEYIMVEELEQHIEAQLQLGAAQILPGIAFGLWLCGALTVAALFLYTNLRFRKGLHASRQPIPTAPAALLVFVCRHIDTPCLFGIFRPQIYVTPAVAQDPALLQYAIAHELTHYRQRDHIWAVLRAFCLVLHWYNPLVWWAARLSQKDGEICCDDATIQRLGEAERAPYGRALIAITCQKSAGILLTATTMTARKSEIRERITAIARQPKMAAYTLIAMVLAVAVAAGCTFTGAQPQETAPIPRETEPTQSAPTTEATMPAPSDDLSQPVAIAKLKNFTRATLTWTDGTYTLTDPTALQELETILQRSVSLGYATKCPFTGQLELQTQEGETILLQLATDNCAVWYDGFDYFTYHRLIPDWGYTHNDELTDLFR